MICTPEGKEVGLAVVSAGKGFDKEVNSLELSIAWDGWLLLLLWEEEEGVIEVSETAASLPFTLATIWLRFIASSDLWLPKCFTSILEPFVVTLPAIVDESHWLLDSEAACSTLTLKLLL